MHQGSPDDRDGLGLIGAAPTLLTGRDHDPLTLAGWRQRREAVRIGGRSRDHPSAAVRDAPPASAAEPATARRLEMAQTMVMGIGVQREGLHEVWERLGPRQTDCDRG